MQSFTKQWDKKFDDFCQEGENQQKAMEEKHESELTRSRAELE
jgi:hypothetical protein